MILKVNYYIIISLLFTYIIGLNSPVIFAAQPASNNYKLNEFSFGAGGTQGSNSNNYSLFGVAGEIEQGQAASNTYKLNGGLTFMMQSEVPPAPTFTNPANYYNKLKLILNPGNNPSDSYFAIAISTDNFVADTKYIQDDNTVGSTLGTEDWQTYADWGMATGFNIINLIPGTTYTVKVASRQGNFTQSPFGPTSQASTINPTLTFDIDVAPSDTETSSPYSMDIGSLTPATVTTAPDKIWIDLSTNATAGGLIYIYGSNNGLLSTTAGSTITAVSADLSSSPQGYGARSNSTAQSAGGPFQALSPYDGANDIVGTIDNNKRLLFDSSGSPISSGRASLLIKAKSTSTTPAAPDYSDTLTIIASGSF